MNVRFVHGFRKLLLDLMLLVRVLVRGIPRFGLLGFVREVRQYARDNRNVLAGSAQRYVERQGEVYAASAMPPISSPRFADYLLDEISTFNRKQTSPTLFALVSASSQCPYRCRYCYALDDLCDEEVVPVEVLERTVRELGERGVKNIFFTGGEVMKRAEALPGLMAATKDAVEAFWLVSSGWQMTKEVLEPLIALKLKGVVISLDSRREAEAVKSKGHRDSYKHAVNAIRAAGELGLIVSVDCMVDERFLDRAEFEAYCDFLRDLGVHFVNFFPPHRVGGAKKYQMSVLSAAQLDELEALMNGVNSGRRHRNHPIAYSAVVWERRRGCSAGQQFVYVTPKGNINPCPFLAAPAGNILTKPVGQILDELQRIGERGGCYHQYEGISVGARTRLPVLQPGADKGEARS